MIVRSSNGRSHALATIRTLWPFRGASRRPRPQLQVTPAARPLRHPAGRTSTISWRDSAPELKYLHTVVHRVAHIHSPGRIDGDVNWIVELTGRKAVRAPSAQERARRGEDLHAVVLHVEGDHQAVIGNRDAAVLAEPPVRASRGAPPCKLAASSRNTRIPHQLLSRLTGTFSAT